MSVVSFTPTKNYPSFSGIISQVIAPTVYSNAGPNTITASAVLGGYLAHTAAAAQTDTLPTAGLLVPYIEGAQIGSSIEFYVKASGAGTITVAMGAGGTANPGDTFTVATGQIRAFLLTVTALPDNYGNGATYTVYSLGSSAY